MENFSFSKKSGMYGNDSFVHGYLVDGFGSPPRVMSLARASVAWAFA